MLIIKGKKSQKQNNRPFLKSWMCFVGFLKIFYVSHKLIFREYSFESNRTCFFLFIHMWCQFSDWKSAFPTLSCTCSLFWHANKQKKCQNSLHFYWLVMLYSRRFTWNCFTKDRHKAEDSGIITVTVKVSKSDNSVVICSPRSKWCLQWLHFQTRLSLKVSPKAGEHRSPWRLRREGANA